MYRVLLLIFILPLVLSAQTGERHGVIARLSDGDTRKAISGLSERMIGNPVLTYLGQHVDAYLIEAEVDDELLYRYCLSDPNILDVEINAVLSPRVKPNDPRVTEQYYLSLIKAFEAWETTTGGVSYTGKKIVIGIVDEGFDIQHEDLAANIYTNPDEIEGDNIDNDNNGYTDDIKGWNTRTSKPVHDIKSHGTNVIGVLGARGDNGKGISGINWNISLLPVTTGFLVSDVLKGYDYLLNERKLYNQSGGTKGSNIVVINYSGGLSNAFAADYPIWCGLYDKMGAEGIVNVAATTNENDNVEIVGDMPSTCNSPYLIVVNSTDKTDEKDPVTGYGNISVDISAPGDRILTTDTQAKGLYRTETGTSLSTPIVAGAAALLMSIPCEAINTLATDDPPSAALAIKQVLMDNTDKKSSLQNKTVSGGRLNIDASIKDMINKFCTVELAPKGKLNVVNAVWTDQELTVRYVSPDAQALQAVIYDPAGREVYRSSVTPPVFGEKVFTLNPGRQLPGMLYFVALIHGTDMATRGFNVQDPR